MTDDRPTNPATVVAGIRVSESPVSTVLFDEVRLPESVRLLLSRGSGLPLWTDVLPPLPDGRRADVHRVAGLLTVG